VPLAKDDLLEIHEKMIEKYGGAHGILNEGTLDYAVFQATKAKHFREEAAVLLEIIAREHPFVDGNKRTAFAAADATVRLNGYRIVVQDDEAIAFLLKVAQGKASHKRVIGWIEDRLKRLPSSFRGDNNGQG